MNINETEYNSHELILKTLSFSILTIFFTVWGITFILLSHIKPNFNSFESVALGQKRYTIVDNLYDANAFADYGKSLQNMNALGAFYNQLNQSSRVNLLSIFNQSVSIKDFKGDDWFYYDPELLDVSNIAINAVQMNQQQWKWHRKLASAKPPMPSILYLPLTENLIYLPIIYQHSPA